MNARQEAAARRLRLALDPVQSGEDLMRQRLRREHPELSPSAIEQRLAEWLRTRPRVRRRSWNAHPLPAP